MCVQVMLQQATTTSTQHENSHSRYVGELESFGPDVPALNTVSDLEVQYPTRTVCRVAAATSCESLQALLQQKLQQAAPKILQARRAVLNRASQGANMAR